MLAYVFLLSFALNCITFYKYVVTKGTLETRNLNLRLVHEDYRNLADRCHQLEKEIGNVKN